MQLELKIIRNHRHEVCPLCQGKDHPFISRILVQMEIDICGECFQLRKEAFFYYREHLDQVRLRDLKVLGLLPAPN